MPGAYPRHPLFCLVHLIRLSLLCGWMILPPAIIAEELQGPSDPHIIERAKTDWESGAITPALETLEQGIEAHPDALTLHKLRGDILATSRASTEALQAYETVLGMQPSALDVRWAKWSLLVRSGQGEQSVEELRRIAAVDTRNPLIHLRLARELRKLDHLETSRNGPRTI